MTKSYGFVLMWRKDEHRHIAPDGESVVDVDVRGRKFQIKPIGSSTVNEAGWLALWGRDYESGEAAKEDGLRAQRALTATAFDLAIPAESADGEPNIGLGKGVVAALGDKGVQILIRRRGVTVFEESADVRILSGHATATVITHGFVGHVADRFDSADRLSNRLILALELYNGLPFEASMRSRFLHSVVVVESLAQLQDESQDVIDAIAELTAAAKMLDTTERVRELLLNGLGRLRKKSVKRSCSELVAAVLGKDAAKAFEDAYDMRSRILHGDRQYSDVELQAAGLPDLVRRLLAQMLADETSHDQ